MANAANSQRQVVLRAVGLGFGYPKQAALFTDLSFNVPSGVTWLAGDESSGKTTLLRLLAGALAAKAGTLEVNGDLLPAQELAYRRLVFWVDPRSQAFDALKPQAYWDTVRAQHPTLDENMLMELTRAFALEAHLPKCLYMLSTGTKRKVFFAAALASGAVVTLLDEPFAALDRASTAAMLELLGEAATHTSRAWVVADYVAPSGVELAATIDLDD